MATEEKKQDDSLKEQGQTAAVAQTAPIEDRIAELDTKKAEARASGGEQAIARQHDRGKLTARERIETLLDGDSFVETDQLVRHRSYGFGIEGKRPYSDAVVTGWGTIEGRKVFVFAEDFTVFGGSLSEVMAEIWGMTPEERTLRSKMYP